ncbi:MAG: CoA pyrophosphatase [Candidatus Methanomethylicia archaeon]
MFFEDLRLRLMNLNFDLKVDVDKAAVAVLLWGGEELEALYIRRAFNPMDPWSGQVAFPGGRCKIYDADIIETAIRETYEELGFKFLRSDVVGVLGVFSPLNEVRLKVFPVLVNLRIKPKVKISREIKDYQWIPLKNLGYGEKLIGDKIVGGYVYDDYFIWGLTARITERLLKLL